MTKIVEYQYVMTTITQEIPSQRKDSWSASAPLGSWFDRKTMR